MHVTGVVNIVKVEILHAAWEWYSLNDIYFNTPDGRKDSSTLLA